MLNEILRIRRVLHSLPTDASQYGSYTSTNEPAGSFEAFIAAQQTTVLIFTEVVETVTVHGDLRYAESDATSTAWGYDPSSSVVGGDMWFNISKSWYDVPVAGNYAFQTIMHETGHAFGLKHPHETMNGFAAMPAQVDSLDYTVMSYRGFVGASTTSGYTNAFDSYPTTLMMYDIAALQHMYDAGIDTAMLVPTNAAPIITSTAPSARLTEWADKSADDTANTLHVATGTITYSDADALDIHTARVAAKGAGYLGSLTLDTNAIDSGDRVGWRFAVDDRTMGYLKSGQTLTQSYDVTIDDGRGGTSSQSITIAMVGTDDATTTKVTGKGRAKGNEVADVPPGQLKHMDMSEEQAPAPVDGEFGGPGSGLDPAMQPKPYAYDYFLT